MDVVSAFNPLKPSQPNLTQQRCILYVVMPKMDFILLPYPRNTKADLHVQDQVLCALQPPFK